MARQPRLLVDGFPLHIVQRGNNRERCFFADHDYLQYLEWLMEALNKCECMLHAYVLMTNHVHLLMTPNIAAKIPNLVISLGRRYVRYINRRHDRTGTLWQGRYKSSLIATDDYLLATYRYIELNPVRAGMVKDPGLYRWSSYCGNGLGRLDALLTPHPLYAELGQTEDARRNAYRGLFGTASDDSKFDEIRQALRQSQPVGKLK